MSENSEIKIFLSFPSSHPLHVYILHGGHLGVWPRNHPRQICLGYGLTMQTPNPQDQLLQTLWEQDSHKSIRTSAGPVVSEIDSAKHPRDLWLARSGMALPE